MRDVLEFEWHDAKALANQRKHGVSFETALLVFSDPGAFMEYDRTVEGEARWRVIGYAGCSLMLTVIHIFHETDHEEIIRIISTRKADRHERKRYEEQNREVSL